MISIARTRLFAPIALGAVLIAGCGSSSSSSNTQSAASTPSSTTASSTTAASTPSPYGSSSAGTSSGQAAGVALVSTKQHGKLGTVLAAGPKHLTVYLFEADKNGKSACSGQCAKVWPPVLGKASASGKASSSMLGTLTRSDGKVQVTYNGHPLYYFAKDKDDGDAYGQGAHAFGSDWYALSPKGSKVDES